jgi:hypothetical protein
MKDLAAYGFKIEARAPQTESRSFDRRKSEDLFSLASKYGFTRADAEYEDVFVDKQGISAMFYSDRLEVSWNSYDTDSTTDVFKTPKLHPSPTRVSPNTITKMTQNWLTMTTFMESKVMPYVSELRKLLPEVFTFGKLQFKTRQPDSDYSATRLVCVTRGFESLVIFPQGDEGTTLYLREGSNYSFIARLMDEVEHENDLEWLKRYHAKDFLMNNIKDELAYLERGMIKIQALKEILA